MIAKNDEIFTLLSARRHDASAKRPLQCIVEDVMKRFMLLAVLLSSGCAPIVRTAQHPQFQARRAYVTPYAPYVWSNVVALQRESLVSVLTTEGRTIIGRFSRANQDGIWLEQPGTRGRYIDRPDVLQVDLVEPPGSRMKKIGKGMLIGALVGAGFATAVLGAAHESSDPKNPGQVIAAAAGIGALAGGQYVTEMRAARTVYIAP